jgi:CRP-like cAMP-binding protein
MANGLPRWLRWVRDDEHVRRVSVLAEAPIFAGLPRRLLSRLATKLFEKAYAPGDTVFREGDPARGLFIVLEGEVEVIRAMPDGEQRMATFGPGRSFGELAFIDGLPRSATARVTTAARLLILYRTHFEALVEGERRIAMVVMHNLLRMLAGYVRASRGGPVPPPVAAAPRDGEPASGTPVSRVP